MCGIAGMIAKENLAEEQFDKFNIASNLMNHRGPDFIDSYRFENVLLIHYRLSIIDLDARSNQPFESQSKDTVGVYNGEIYNFKKLATKVTCPLRTTSDTEVMIEGFEEHGNSVVPKWNGIFASALLNKPQKKVTLIRDRFGVKPLYFYEDDRVLLFASEAKVIYEWLPSFTISYKGLSEYLWYGNTIGNQTMVNKVEKFDPGTLLEIDLKSFVKKKIKFWENPGTRSVKKSEADHVHTIKDLLGKAVNRQLIADVPLGILLSGGIDSSAIVAMASRQSNTKLDTYSVEYDFNIGGESELKRAALIADKYQTNHHELIITAENIPDIFSALVFQYDEPFADAASIPLFQLAKACGKDKTVILQGDGGDEIFAGYRRYNIMDWLNFWRYTSKLSYPLIKNDRWRERMKRMSFVLNQKDNGLRMAYLLTQDVPYQNPYGVISEGLKTPLLKENPFQAYQEMNIKYKDENLVQRLLYADVEILLQHTYLEKVDKATMLSSVESRVPFLDNDLTNYVLGLPSDIKVKRGRKKHLLRKALHDLVPDEILNGKKRGFDVPYKKWLKTNLYDFAYDTFKENQFNAIININKLLQLLEEHKKGKIDHGPILWKSLVLCVWLNLYRDKITIE